MSMKVKDPISGYSHLAGAILVFAGSIALAARAENAAELFSFVIFSASALALYAASAWYHLFGAPRNQIGFARKLDHALIYFLIAGTFTPFCLILVRGAWGMATFAVIWLLAAIGTAATFFSSFWKRFPRWAATGLYLAMGWLGLVIIYPLRHTPGAIIFLGLGGVLYSIGAIIYARKSPNFGAIGFHELFHFFTLAGTLAHYWCFWRYIAAP